MSIARWHTEIVRLRPPRHVVPPWVDMPVAAPSADAVRREIAAAIARGDRIEDGPEHRWRLDEHAHHEAGHVVAGFLTGQRVREAQIPIDVLDGYTLLSSQGRDFRDGQDAEGYIVYVWGGLVAEAMRAGRWPWYCATRDMQLIRQVSESLAAASRGFYQDGDELAADLLTKTILLLSDPLAWTAVQRVMSALLSEGRLQRGRLRDIFEASFPGARFPTHHPLLTRLGPPGRAAANALDSLDRARRSWRVVERPQP